MELTDIRSIVDLAVDQISSQSSTNITEEEVILSDDSDIDAIIEESLKLVEEESVKAKMAKVANETIRIVRAKLSQEFTEYNTTTKVALIKMLPEIASAVMKKDVVFLTKIAETSGIALKYYFQQLVLDISSELITTGVTEISKEANKIFSKLKDKVIGPEPETTEYEVVD